MLDPRNPDYTNTPASAQRPTFGYALADPAAAPYVTILTPFYNTREIFHETAASLFRQSLQQWEWLIVNDASTDPAALAILEGYRRRDPRIRVIDNQVNQGLAGTRNVGFEAATTEYVFLLDDDDLMEPTAIEKFVCFLESYPEYVVVNGWSVAFGAMQYLWPQGFNRGAEMLKENFATGRALVRRVAHRAVGGYDASLRDGMEDWEFWLRLADHGLWGATIPEYCDWYRRRPSHADRWENLDKGDKQRAFGEWLRQRYHRLCEGGFPQVEPRWQMPLESIREAFPSFNRLAKGKPRCLLIVPWLALGGADKFNLDLLQQLIRREWEVTVATTQKGDHAWAPEFGRHTPDIFILHNFLRPTDHPAFLRYLIETRRPDVVMTTNSELGYLLLPYLRVFCPQPAYVDFCHSETINWKNGGYPRYAVANQDLLDLNLVASEHLKSWMVARGAAPKRIEVVHINVDVERWAPCPQTRRRVRAAHGIPPDQPLILFAGRLQGDKQPHVLAQVLQRLVERGLDFHAFIAGDGPDRAWLEELVTEHALQEQVTLLGGVPSDQVRELMAASDIFFLPSLWEGIALTIYEAMACGLAVVGADVGGQRELVTPECGRLLPKADPATEVAAYTEELTALLADLPRCRELGRRARERVAAHFRLDEMGEQIVALFRKAGRLKAEAPRAAVGRSLALESATQTVELQRVTVLLDRRWAEAQHLSEVAQTRGQRISEQERIILELRAWSKELQECKTWLEQRCLSAELSAAERETVIQQQHAWIEELQECKAWLEGCCEAARRQAAAQGGLPRKLLKWVAGRRDSGATHRPGR